MNKIRHNPTPTANGIPRNGRPWCMNKMWAVMKTKPYVWATFVWNLFDFAVSTRHEGGVPGRNDKGLVTYDRQIKKDAFYFYKANWSDEPVLYITDRRFTERTNAVTDVKIYSNARTVELLLNGKSTRLSPERRRLRVYLEERQTKARRKSGRRPRRTATERN